MELEFVRWLRQRLPQNEQVVVGPGDDAAVLRPRPGNETVVTTDMLTDGIDFVLAECDPRRVGRKALAVNLSDLAAMAAEPVAAFVSVALPRSGGLELAQALYEGMAALAEEYNVALAGGDTNTWEGPLCINVTALGEVPVGRAWLRSTAQPGDALLVTGELGGSILGRHFDFEPRVREALALAREYDIHAAMDISDGLSLDLHRLCQESRCGAILEMPWIPVARAAVELECRDGADALQHALSDGEDFELLLAVPPDEAQRMLRDQPLRVPLTQIGQIVAEPGVIARDETGGRLALTPKGYVH